MLLTLDLEPSLDASSELQDLSSKAQLAIWASENCQLKGANVDYQVLTNPPAVSEWITKFEFAR